MFAGQIYSSRGVYISPDQSTFYSKCGLRALVESFENTDFIVYLFLKHTINPPDFAINRNIFGRFDFFMQSIAEF